MGRISIKFVVSRGSGSIESYKCVILRDFLEILFWLSGFTLECSLLRI